MKAMLKRIWCRWFHDYGVTVVAYGRFTCKKCGAEFGRDNL